MSINVRHTLGLAAIIIGAIAISLSILVGLSTIHISPPPPSGPGGRATGPETGQTLRYTRYGGFETPFLDQTPWRVLYLDQPENPVLPLPPVSRTPRRTIVELTTRDPHSGRQCLQMENPPDMAQAGMLVQKMEAPDLSHVALNGWVRSEDVRKIGLQTVSCNFFLIMMDKDNRVLKTLTSPVIYGTTSWHHADIGGYVPADAHYFSWGFSFTMAGTVWLDDISLIMSGSRRSPTD